MRVYSLKMPDHTPRTRLASYLTVPNGVTAIRLALFPAVWTAALVGQQRMTGFLIALALFTDALDGYLARRLGQASAFGAKFDSFTDNLFLASAPVLLAVLEPEVIRRNAVFCAIFAGLLVAVFAVMWIRFRRNVEIHTYLAKAGVGVMWSFFVVTLTIGYSPLFFAVALGTSYLYLVEDLVLLLTRSQIDEHERGLLFGRDVRRRP